MQILYSRIYRIIELLVIFVALPVLYRLHIIPGSKFVPLLVVFGYSIFILLKDKEFDRKKLGFNNFHTWKYIIIRFFVLAILLTAFVVMFSPGSFLYLVKNRPWLWLAIMIFYPVFSVYPQEFIYRPFFYRRYRFLIGNKHLFDFFNATIFCLLHIIFENVIALIFSFMAGYIFARTYRKSQSLLVVSVEHALYGCLIFTNGLGQYFYIGS